MARVFLVDLEAVETRYTAQWKHYVPQILAAEGHDVHIISGPEDIPAATTPGAFLNFGGTNIYKAAQVEKMGRLFCNGDIKPGDHFIFTDAWHPGIINLKYMSQLLNIPVTIHALWHAGSYDPHDFLGRLIGDQPWVRNAEYSFFNAVDHNYFATDFHINMFCENLMGVSSKDAGIQEDKIVRTGWPMGYMDHVLGPFKDRPKRDLILFPHRIAPEKQVEIFRDLARELPEYEFVVCQDQQLSKDQYHELLAASKIVFSASLQETLGIGCYEGAILNAIPMVPDRLSYKEMYLDSFKYPTEWTSTWDNYRLHRDSVVARIRHYMNNYDSLCDLIAQQTRQLTDKFFTAGNLIQKIAN